MGAFGQEACWDIQQPATYQRSSCDGRTTVAGEMEEGEEQSREDQSNEEGRGRLCDLVSQGQTSQEEGQWEVSSVEELIQPNQTESVIPSENPAQNQQTKGCVCRGVYEDLRKKAAVRCERRRVFGDIDFNKLSLVEGVCTPYQALVLQDYQEVARTEDLPISPWMQRHSPSCLSGAGLSSLQLSITVSNREQEAENGSQ